MPAEVIAFPAKVRPASSNVMINNPSSLYAGEFRIIGTTVFRKASAETRPPGSTVFLHFDVVPFPSCPSWQRLGVMKEKFGVVDSNAKSCARWSKLTTFLAQGLLAPPST